MRQSCPSRSHWSLQRCFSCYRWKSRSFTALWNFPITHTKRKHLWKHGEHNSFLSNEISFYLEVIDGRTERGTVLPERVLAQGQSVSLHTLLSALRSWLTNLNFKPKYEKWASPPRGVGIHPGTDSEGAWLQYLSPKTKCKIDEDGRLRNKETVSQQSNIAEQNSASHSLKDGESFLPSQY